MLYIIRDKHDNTLVVQSTDNRSLMEVQYCIKMAVDHELRENGGVDMSNLANSLYENNFSIYGHRIVEIQ